MLGGGGLGDEICPARMHCILTYYGDVCQDTDADSCRFISQTHTRHFPLIYRAFVVFLFFSCTSQSCTSQSCTIHMFRDRVDLSWGLRLVSSRRICAPCMIRVSWFLCHLCAHVSSLREQVSGRVQRKGIRPCRRRHASLEHLGYMLSASSLGSMVERYTCNIRLLRSTLALFCCPFAPWAVCRPVRWSPKQAIVRCHTNGRFRVQRGLSIVFASVNPRK
jgi:hypothetical protein